MYRWLKLGTPSHESSDKTRHHLDNQADPQDEPFAKRVLSAMGSYSLVGFHNKSELSDELLVAVKKGNLKKVARLIQLGADVDTFDGGCLSALHLAIVNRRREVALFLIDNDADVNTSGGEYGHTPLHTAVKDGDLAIVKALLGKVTDTDVRSRWGLTPLHIAAFRGHNAVMKVLINHHLDINALDANELAPLDWALQSHFEANDRAVTIRLLLEHGAEPVARGQYEIPEQLLPWSGRN